MQFRLIGHPDLESQVPKVFAADPKQGPKAVARIRGRFESFDEDPAELEPAPVAQHSWTQGVLLNVGRGEARSAKNAGAGHDLYLRGLGFEIRDRARSSCRAML